MAPSAHVVQGLIHRISVQLHRNAPVTEENDQQRGVDCRLMSDVSPQQPTHKKCQYFYAYLPYRHLEDDANIDKKKDH